MGKTEGEESVTLFRNPFSMEAAFTDTDLGIRIVFSKMTADGKRKRM